MNLDTNVFVDSDVYKTMPEYNPRPSIERRYSAKKRGRVSLSEVS
jgi:hypothetical protein